MTKVEPAIGPNVRNDMGIETGMEVTAYYDPLLAKLIVSAENRKDAIDKMIWALSNYVVMGITTNISFLKEVLVHEAFQAGNISTHFIDTYFKDLLDRRDEFPIEALIALSIYDTIHAKAAKKETAISTTSDPYSPWKRVGKWRMGD
jgi:acetyl/propionyl-CoA carboxylase alpha subunit